MSHQKREEFGIAGAPINRTNPFYFGFVATLGALAAIVLLRALASASQIFIIILLALYLAMGLNPAVEALRKRDESAQFHRPSPEVRSPEAPIGYFQ